MRVEAAVREAGCAHHVGDGDLLRTVAAQRARRRAQHLLARLLLVFRSVAHVPFARQAVTARATRTTGASRIGRFTSAAPTASTTSMYQTQSYEPVASKMRPPSHAPRKPPTWWLSMTTPNSVAMFETPKNLATRPAVGGTVER